ncbi:hypothetical protein BJ138DRAFT_1153939 [Hygrophoropsis aurantiaca]|uniref:Uncharacterized protein n=1 Tax=Hygrophoropsis aurantiaca TaxID=72124 RepID=A0ACB8A9G1_9AGAM|nr:hypothetical protein BJ138DRAFT_1153939 [Hygrophoropsis aurantiaca]
MSSASALSSIALAQISSKLRYANFRYFQIAQQLRCKLHLTHHAKRRACWAGLRVDIMKARNCPGNAISIKPLPIVDTTPSPVSERVASIRSSLRWRSDLSLQFVDNTLGLELPEVPQAVVSPPESCIREIESQSAAISPPSYATHGHSRLIVRIPPHNHFNKSSPAIPGAPLLRPRELPEDSEAEMMDIQLDSPRSSILNSFENVRVYIRIPPKRKLQELDDENESYGDLDAQLPKRRLRRRWIRYQNNTDRRH